MKTEGSGLTADQKIGYLEAENLKLRRENTRLRKALHENSRHARRIEKAHEDALLLASWRAAGIIPSRRYAGLYEMTQPRFENALGLLKLARVVVRQRHWAITDLTVIEHKLGVAKQKAIEDPSLFFLRMARHHQPPARK